MMLCIQNLNFPFKIHICKYSQIKFFRAKLASLLGKSSFLCNYSVLCAHISSPLLGIRVIPNLTITDPTPFANDGQDPVLLGGHLAERVFVGVEYLVKIQRLCRLLTLIKLCILVHSLRIRCSLSTHSSSPPKATPRKSS